MSMERLRWRIELMFIEMVLVKLIPRGSEGLPFPYGVGTTPLPPRPFTPAGVKGGFNSRFGAVAPNAVLHARGCDALVVARMGARDGRSQRLNRWSATACTTNPSASAATRDTTQSACKVSAANEHAASGSRTRSPAMVTVPSSAAVGGSGLALFEAQPSLARPRPTRAAQGTAQRHGLWLAFSWGTFFWRSKRKCLGCRAETRPATKTKLSNKEMPHGRRAKTRPAPQANPHLQ
jgi:hypothetical protein